MVEIKKRGGLLGPPHKNRTINKTGILTKSAIVMAFSIYEYLFSDYPVFSVSEKSCDH
jgi:hypothetical protein